MFGQPSTSPFSTPGTAATSTPFGATAASSTPAFGSPAPAFGSGATGGGGFGFGAAAPQPAAAPTTGFGGFGSTNTNTPTATGMTSTFGFGSPAPTTNTSTGFGASNTSASTPFGAPAPATGGGLFGSPAPAPSGGGLFGSTTTSGSGFNSTPAPSTTFGSGGAFGSSTGTGGGFGSTNTTSAFGSAAPSGGLFGNAPTPATTGFGTTTSQNTGFGAAPATSGGLFGSTSNSAAPSTGFGFGSTQQGASANTFGNKPGTLAVPYEITRREDGTGQMGQRNSVLLQSITAMQAYESKSFEELRMEDYLAGNKGAQGQAVGGFGGTPATNTGGGLFGMGNTQPAPAPAFGSTSSTFGSPAPAPTAFGGSTFGSTAAPTPAAGGFSFGASPAPAPATGGLFGSAPTPAAGGSLFGNTSTPAPAPTGLFGAAPTPATGGLFGSTTPAPAAGGGLFGSTTPAPAGGLFGAPAPATGGLFGAAPTAAAPAPATGGLFGGTPSAPAPSTGFSFGSPTPAPATSGGLFGSAPTTTAPTPSTGLFGAAPAAGGSLFGGSQPAPATGGLFGAPPAAPASGSLFGTPASAPAAGGGLFGSTFGTSPASTLTTTGAVPGAAPVAGGMSMGMSGNVAPPPAETLLAQKLAAVESQKKELAVLEAWRGSSPNKVKGLSTSSPTTAASPFERDVNAMKSVGLFGPSHVSSIESSALNLYKSMPLSSSKIRPRGFGAAKSKSLTPSTGHGPNVNRGVLSPNTFIGSTTKHLVIKPGSLTPKPKMRLLLTENNTVEDEKTEKVNEVQSPTAAIIRGNQDNVVDTPERKITTDQSELNTTKFLDSTLDTPKEVLHEHEISPKEMPPKNKASDEKKSLTGLSDESYNFYQTVIENGEEKSHDTNTNTLPISSLLPKLSKEGYIMSPPIEELSKMSEAELATVTNFFVERVGYGSVAWEGAVDVREVNLDLVLAIEAKDVRVYDDDEETKPPVGSKLNRPAIITISNIFPKEGKESTAEVKDRFERRIIKTTKKMGAELISYDVGLGEWKFRVLHFSRYGLDDDSDDEQELVEVKIAPPTQKLTEEKTSAENISHFHVPEDDIDENSQNSDGSNSMIQDQVLVLDAAEKAYESISQSVSNNVVLGENDFPSPEHNMAMECEYEESLFDDEGENVSMHLPPENVTATLQSHRSLPKISRKCADIASKCGVTRATSSKTDFGLRMGRSFRVGWRPNGLLLQPNMHLKNQTSSTLVQLRPVVKPKGTHSQSCSEELLSIHLKHSSALRESKTCPAFSLSTQDSATTQKHSQRILISTVHDLKHIMRSDDKSNDEVENVRSLLSLSMVLFGSSNDNDDDTSNLRKVEALRKWLREICSKEVEKDILSALSRKDYYGAIFAALSGDNKSEAASIASKYGLYMLSSIITNSSALVSDELYSQLGVWNRSDVLSEHIPETLYRIYSLLSQNLELEEKIYESSKASDVLDWKRLMAISMQSHGAAYENESTLSKLIEQYGAKVESGSAPPPHPMYMNSNAHVLSGNGDIKCTLYKLFELYANTDNDQKSSSLMHEIISPLGHTKNEHDVSSAFFLATYLTALEVCEPLSDVQEFQLLDSYASQLVSEGHWEYAIYVVLYSFGHNNTKMLMSTKKNMAMDLLFRHFTDNSTIDPLHQQRRTFLEEKVGIPSTWFAIALSHRSVYLFNPTEYARNTLQFSMADALHTYEQNVLPILLISGAKESYHGIVDFLDFMKFKDVQGQDFSTLSGVVSGFISLYSTFLEASSTQYADVAVGEMHDVAERLNASIQDLKKNSVIPHRFPGFAHVSVESCLVELSRAVEHILHKLECL